MADNTIDTLDIQISSSTKSASRAINNMIKKLSELDSTLGGFSASQVRKVTNSMNYFSNSLSRLASINLKTTGLNAAINSINRLSQADLSKFDTGKLSEIIAGLSKLGNLPDVSSNTARVTGSLARLANSSKSIEKVSAELPNFGVALKQVVTDVKSIGKIPDSVNSFTESIVKLANTGNKVEQTASHFSELSDGVRKFFEEMKDAPEISENTIRMTEALSRLAEAGEKAGAASNSITNTFSRISSISGKVASIFGTVASKAKSGIGAVISGISNLANRSNGLKTSSSNIGNFIKTILGFKAASAVMNKFNQAMDGEGILEIGSDITEVENIVDVAFGSMADKAYDFASTASKQFGLSELAAKNYSGTMMAMMKSSGVAQDSAAEMSTTLAGLAGDLASFYNIDTDTAFYKIRAGISGKNFAPCSRKVA